MQYIKQFVAKKLFGWAEGKEVDLKNYPKIDQTPIGSGTYGCVYKVQNKNNKQIYAAKVSRLATIDPKSFVRELEILLKIQHPAILPFEGYSLVDFSGESNPTILTKYAKNGSLRHVLECEQRSLSPEDWDNTKKHIILYGIAKGMSYLHKQNYIHRDLKPENILLDDYLFPQICDFGLSKCYSPDEMSSLTANCGTTAYMAPEVFQGQKYDKSVDVYSYGLIMFEVVTGTKIFPKMNSSYILQTKVAEGYRPQFPKGLYVHEQIVELIENCWSGDPSVRPTFDEIVEILENEEVISSFSIDNDVFESYTSVIHKAQQSSTSSVSQLTEDCINKSTSSTIRKVDISSSFEQYSRQKIVENEEELNMRSIYPASQFVFLDENCQKLVKLAESGDTNMMVAVADSLIKGIHGFTKNIEVGVKFLKNAAEMKNVEASEMYASMLINGDMIPTNIEKAEPIVEFLMDKNCPTAKKMWAQIELTKKSPDYQKIKSYLKESASDGNVESMVLYAKFCLMKKEQTQMEPDEKEAMKYIELAADSGNQDAKKMIDDLSKCKEEEERRRKEEEERRRREEEEERRRREEEERRRREEEEERRRRDEEERRRRDEEERRRRDEEERRRREEEEERRRRDEEERRRRDEEERRRRDEEERRRREEEERRRWEEEERRRREEQERIWREAHRTNYYPRCNPNSQSIVDSLKSIGVDSSFANRNRIANRNGISNYSGSASQNVHLLSLLKNGQLIQP